MKTTLQVPFYAQKEILTNGEANSACGIVCVKMILDYAGKKNDIEDLIKEGYIIGGKVDAGWKHETIVRVLRNHGILAFPQEFRSHIVDTEKEEGILNEKMTNEMRDVAITKFEMFIDQGYPVMVSVKPGFGNNKGDHLILIVGYDEENLYINDSGNSSEEESPIKVSKNKFMEYWKGLTIFTEW